MVCVEKKKLDFPILYMVMPMEERVGWEPGLHNSEPVYEVVANIVLKCYVVGWRKKYVGDGTSEMIYEVVQRYGKANYGYSFEPVVPKYEPFHKEWVNSVLVGQLFNSFDEAKIVANQLNEKILKKRCKYCTQEEKVEETEKYHKILDKYEGIEKTFEQETCDMKVSSLYDIYLKDIMEKVMEKPTEFCTQLISVLSDQEREYLSHLLEHQNSDEKTNEKLKLKK